MSSSEFTEWLAYYETHPFGDIRDDFRTGIVASTIANVNRSQSTAFTPADFMPLAPKPPRAQPGNTDRMLDAAAAITQAFGGVDARKRE